MKPITIIGGGLAGLTLGIGLRRRGVPVKIFEAGQYPRHRVCGEFISGNGLDTLERLELYDKMIGMGAITAQTAAFFSEQRPTGFYSLSKPALCLSRFEMDALFAKEFRRLGGDLKENTRWTEKVFGESIVRASGRRIQAVEKGWRLFGLKVHARNVKLEADLEMHFRADGYVGICRLEEGKVNICGLLRSRTALPGLNENWTEFLAGEPGSILRQRLAKAEFDKASFCSVAGISLKPKRAMDLTEISVGDALTMIPPLTGNGMSMAFESAELAADALHKYSLGESTWGETQQDLAEKCDRIFHRRLFWAECTQRGLMQPFVRQVIFAFSSHSCRLSGFLFSKTR